MVFRLCLLLSIAISTSVFAAKTNKPVAKTAEECAEDEAQKLAGAVMGAVSKIKGCPNIAKLDGLCSSINSQTKDSSNGEPYKYYYQRKILEAACVDASKDSPEEISQKVQAMWKAFNEKLTCNTPSFNVPNGSVLKYAVNMNSYDFLDDAIKRWKVDLNKIDTADNRTLLDYITFMQEKYKDTPNAVMLDTYYKKLVKAGAKHKADL